MRHLFRRLSALILPTQVLWLVCCQEPLPPSTDEGQKYTYRGWNILSSHRENGLKTLDKAAEYGVNHIELSHYQLCHDLKDLRKEENRQATNFFIDAAHQRGIDDVYVWDHAFYDLSYYPDQFKVDNTFDTTDLRHHTAKFSGGIQQQLDLDDPEFWQWVYQDYDSLLAMAPQLNGVVLTFIETGSYVIYQHSDKLTNKSQKLAALVDSLGNYFIDRKALKLTIRTFIYNQFEKDIILEALRLIKRNDLTVMIKMVPHDWFMTYPYQDYVADIPFPVVIEYDAGMEYAGENIIVNSFPNYFADAFRHYHQYDNVVGYCARADRYEETTAVGTPGETNLYVLSRLTEDTGTATDTLVKTFIRKNYGAATLPYLLPAFQSAFPIVMYTMYTLGLHTANHSRLNYHRKTIYHTHTTGEWYAPNDQMISIAHDVNQTLHNYKDVLNHLAFPAYKVDTAGLQKDIGWVLDSGWLSPEEMMTPTYLEMVISEKDYGVSLAEEALARVSEAIPLISDSAQAAKLYHTFNRTLIFAQERRGAAKVVYGYRLWGRGAAYQTDALATLIYEGLDEAEAMLKAIDNYPVHTPLGQWRWHRDRESFSLYQRAITQTGWPEVGLGGITVPRP